MRGQKRPPISSRRVRIKCGETVTKRIEWTWRQEIPPAIWPIERGTNLLQNVRPDGDEKERRQRASHRLGGFTAPGRNPEADREREEQGVEQRQRHPPKFARRHPAHQERK